MSSMPPQRLSRHDALDRLRRCLDEGIVEYHPHFLKRCCERGIDPLDAQHVLRKGVIFDEPEHNVKHQQWRYKVEGKTPDGELIKVVFTFVEDDEALVITVLDDVNKVKNK